MRTALLCLVAVAAALDWWSRLPGTRRGARTVELVSKPLTTVLVIALALTGDAPHEQVVIAVVALSLCLVGDVALLGPPSMFLVGLVAFLAATSRSSSCSSTIGLTHRLAGGDRHPRRLPARRDRRAGHPPRPREPRAPALAVPVGVYLTVILTMAVVGWATGVALVLIGATAFVVSDALLGWDAFVRPRRWLPLAIMVTYHVAIVSLALAV